MKYAFVFTALSLAATATATAAEQVFNENVIVDGSLCAGFDCAAGEAFGVEELKLKDNFTELLFEDTSTSVGYASTDWQLTANDAGYLGSSHFSVVDLDTNWAPLRVEGGARNSALVVDNLGFIGVGTAIPTKHLHFVDGYRPTIRFEQDGSQGETPAIWDILTYENGFIVRDETKGTNRFVVEADGPEYALYVAKDRTVGLGTGTPEASLHIHGYLGKAQILVREVNSSPAPRPLLNLQNNGRPEIVMGNSNTGGEWSFGAGTNFVLKQGAIGSSSTAKTKYLTLHSGSGDLEITGQIITGGSTCGSGCDAVFAPGYTPPSIAAHTEAMYALGHLPNVGPTPENAPINVSDKLGRMLNELEHAHIYIGQLHRENTDLRAEMGRREAALAARIEALEARLK